MGRVCQGVAEEVGRDDGGVGFLLEESSVMGVAI